ncbi:SPOC like C-terminal domain-containing protein [Russula earlei]|uniref:SPOC like C-terminal domain-containing protein n=1 Tax=Russula earlei TaxID=71964 RepID=A0ACC0U1B6_9AGAM|nr:SPOC like C-terminal domain-containing protein [Russula earlei]
MRGIRVSRLTVIMASYDDWNRLDEEEDEEIQDTSAFERKHDVILFAIDCSPSMLASREDPNYENTKTSHLLSALDAVVQVEKRKVVVGPYDSVGIMLYNTTRKNDNGQGSEIKKGTYVYQPMSTINATRILDLNQLIDEAREDPGLLSGDYPSTDKHIPVGDLFTSCNWVLRDGAPKSATKRVFLITDNDDPLVDSRNPQLVTSARTTLSDLLQAGVSVEPFFISADDKPFNQHKFWTSVLVSEPSTDDEDEKFLPNAISITRIDDLLEQMRFHEVPKRALFSIPFELAPGLVISIKGYGLVTEQKKGAYKYFVDLGDKMEVVESRTTHVDEGRESEAGKGSVLFGMTLGETVEDEDIQEHGFGTRPVRAGRRVFYTAEEVRSLRTLDLEPGLKLLGFKDRSELAFEDNVRHSLFIYPDEGTYAGSRRTFTALLSSMIKKGKIALVRALTRRNASPSFCVLLPQEGEDEGWAEPSGFHLIPLPFADDIRAAPIEAGFRAGKELIDAAKSFISKLALRNGTYPPDSYPNPALAFHYAQLEATAFREEFDPALFEDHTLPKNDTIRKKAGPLIKEWMDLLQNDESARAVIVQTGSKRKPVSSYFEYCDHDKQWSGGG